MKYLLIIPSLEIGGAERQAISFARFLLDNGRCVSILSAAPLGKALDVCRDNNIPCHSLAEEKYDISEMFYIGEVCLIQ